MHHALRLFILVAKASLLVTVGCFAIIATGFTFVTTPGVRAAPVVLAVLLSAGGAAWWMFQRLQIYFTQRESRSVARTFGVFTPVSLSFAMLFGEISGGDTAAYLSTGWALFGAFAGVVVFTTVTNFGVTAFALWITRQHKRLEAEDS
jgi:hypothetical protein